MYCEHCGIFVVRDPDACFSMERIVTSWLRGRGRPIGYTRQNRGDNPAAFAISGRMRGVPRRLQPLVDSLPLAVQAALLYAIDCGLLREDAMDALVSVLIDGL